MRNWGYFTRKKWSSFTRFISGRGHLEAEQPYLGDLLTMVINHVSKSWDDPPSSLPSSQVFRRLRVLAKSQEYYTITDAIQELCKWAMKNGDPGCWGLYRHYNPNIPG